jgi:hypothetical protein
MRRRRFASKVPQRSKTTSRRRSSGDPLNIHRELNFISHCQGRARETASQEQRFGGGERQRMDSSHPLAGALSQKRVRILGKPRAIYCRL